MKTIFTVRPFSEDNHIVGEAVVIKDLVSIIVSSPCMMLTHVTLDAEESDYLLWNVETCREALKHSMEHNNCAQYFRGLADYYRENFTLMRFLVEDLRRYRHKQEEFKKLHYVVKDGRGTWVMDAEQFPERSKEFTKIAEGTFQGSISTWHVVPHFRHLGRLFKTTAGVEYYVFSDKSAQVKVPEKL